MRRLALVGAALALAAVGTAQAAATPASGRARVEQGAERERQRRGAKLFAHNARVIQPGVDVRLSSHALAVAFNDVAAVRGPDRRDHGERQSRDRDVRPRRAPEASLRRAGREGGRRLHRARGKIVRWQQVPVPTVPTA